MVGLMTEPQTPEKYTYVIGDPPEGLFAIEASAGTGKTYTVAHMVVDYIEKGIAAPHQLVVVTFTKMATSELSSRIRATMARALARTEEYTGLLITLDGKDHLTQALADFHEIRISTIHGFAQRSLALLGDPVRRVSPEVSGDAFRASVRSDVVRSLEPSDLERVAKISKFATWIDDGLRALSANPDAKVKSSGTKSSRKDTKEPEYRVIEQVVDSARKVLIRRKKILGQVGYDDLMIRLRERLRDPGIRDTFADNIKVVIIDEFQDTDALQWDVFRSLYESKKVKALVVVGDPKQAIYTFRGGDIAIYREALDYIKHNRGTLNHLVENRRSTADFIAAERCLFEKYTTGVGFGFDVGEVTSPPEGLVSNPVHFEDIEATDPNRDVVFTPAWAVRGLKEENAKAVRTGAANDLVRYVQHLLLDEACLIPGVGKKYSRVTSGDICVLVESNSYGLEILSALRGASIPASIVGGANIFASDAAEQWGFLLQAVAAPNANQSAVRFALSWFGGKQQSEVATAVRDDDAAWFHRQQQQLAEWLQIFRTRPREEFIESVLADSDVLERVAQRIDGDRNITDILHVAEILRLRVNDGVQQLYEFIDRASSTSEGDDSGNTDQVGKEWSRRVDRGDQAVRIMTIHQSKGLEFPIVLAPFVGRSFNPKGRASAYRLETREGGETVLDLTVMSSDIGGDIKKELIQSEKRRRLYVALTRAKFHNALWLWDEKINGKGEKDLKSAPVIMTRSEAEELILRNDQPQQLEYQTADVEAPGLRELPSTKSRPELRSRVVATLQTPGRSWSFTSLSKNFLTSQVDVVISDELEPATSDGDLEGEVTDGVAEGDGEVIADFESSARVGRVMHKALQYVDFSASDFRSAVRDQLIEAAQAEGISADPTSSRRSFDHDEAAKMLERAARTNIGAIADGQNLLSLGQSFMLPEMGFDFTLPGTTRSTSELRSILQEELTPDPAFALWVSGLTDKDVSLTGAMTGSLDAVLAWGEGDEAKFLVVDYKSNRTQSGLYDQPTLSSMMNAKSYQLQALIYIVALHRFLRSRMANYSYDLNVAGAAYLFVRGMDAKAPGNGVYAMKPSAHCIERLSDFFDGRLSNDN